MSSQKFERKHFFINRKLQGKYMITFLVPMVVMLLFMIGTLYSTVHSLTESVVVMIQKGVESRVNSHTQDKESISSDDYRVMKQDVNTFLREFNESDTYRYKVSNSLVFVFALGILFVIIQVVFLTVFFSHRLAGPVYRFEHFCKKIIDGDYRERITLRKGDEMRELADRLNEMAEATHHRIKVLSDKSSSQEEKETICEKIQI